MSSRFEISALGAQGDGIAQGETGQVFIPFALPGETVTAALHKDRADLIAVLQPSPLRIEPACRHFGTCGGCAVQHLDAAAYRIWKRDKVVDALRSRRIDVAVDELVPCAPGTRRRVSLAARRTEAGLLLGYHRALSHDIVDIAENPIAVPEIVAALPLLRQLGSLLAGGVKPFRMLVTSTASGLDIAVSDAPAPGDAKRRAVVDFAMLQRFARVSLDGEIIVEPLKPVVMFDEIAVTPPPGAFLQAVAGAESTMAALVCGHLARARRVADLFAGCGTFGLRLARKSEVHAVESDAAALAALDRAARFAPGLRRVTIEKRDLFRRPLLARELDLFEGLVFDPPRAGAEDQCKQLAKSTVPLVAAVSCNPTTLARDLEILIAGGYRVTRVTPIDQFLWSPHVEAVALLEKPRKRRG